MNKYLVSFGQSHTHRINGKTFDCDTLLELEDKDYESAYQHAFDLTEGKFGTLYENEKRNDPEFISLFPKGIIPLNLIKLSNKMVTIDLEEPDIEDSVPLDPSLRNKL